MALVSSNFAERYAELTARVPTFSERLLDVQRREVCARREVEAQADAAFQDVLHIAAIMIADKKARQQGSAALMDAHALTLYKQETAVWFPAAPPRTVPFRANRPLRAFPHAAFKEICEEERELRQWLYGVERRLRQHIEEACGRSYFYLNVIEDTVTKEHRGRQRLMKEEDDTFTDVKQRFFRTVPADYFRHVVLARYGSSVPAAVLEEMDQSFEAQEEKARSAIYAEEVKACKEIFQYMQTAYDVRLFAVNHREVIERYAIEEEEANALFPLVAGLCRADFGGTFYHVPALALHLTSSCTALRALCLAQLQPAAAPHDAQKQPAVAVVESMPIEPVAAPAAVMEVDEAEKAEAMTHEAGEPAYPTSADSSEQNTPPAVDVTRTGEVPSSAADPWEELGDNEEVGEVEKTKEKGTTEEKGEERQEDVAAGGTAPTSAKKKKEWEVNTDHTPAVQTTLYAYEEDGQQQQQEPQLPKLYATDDAAPVLIATEEEAPAKTKAEAEADALAATARPTADETASTVAANAAAAAAGAPALSHNNSELTCSPQPLPQSIFSTEEIFVGDPFSATEKKEKKAKKAKKPKKSKSSKSKRSKSEDPEL